MTYAGNTGIIFYDPLVDGTFQWDVYDYVHCNSAYIESPWFLFQDVQWWLVLKICTMGSNNNSVQMEKHVELFYRKSSSTEEFDIEISLIMGVGNIENLCSYKWKSKPGVKVGEPKILPLSYFLISTLPTEDHLKFFCTIRKLDSDENNKNSQNNETSQTISKSTGKGDTKQVYKKKPMPGSKGMDRLVQNLENMFLERQNTDVILKVRNTEFPAHKSILSARCNTFANIFQHDMTEKISNNVVDIPDCSPEAFKVFLLYLYTGNARNISSDIVCNVYYAADRYQMHDLKEDCIECMIKTLSAETVCDVIALSLLHRESELLTIATDFFRDNLKNILRTVQWQKYLMDHPVHANELLIKAHNA